MLEESVVSSSFWLIFSFYLLAYFICRLIESLIGFLFQFLLHSCAEAAFIAVSLVLIDIGF